MCLQQHILLILLQRFTNKQSLVDEKAMIEVQTCPFCSTELSLKQISDHQSQCSNSPDKRTDASLSPKISNKDGLIYTKIDLNVDLAKNYCAVGKFMEILKYEAQYIVKKYLTEKMKSCQLVITLDQAYATIQTQKQINKSQQYDIKELLQEQLNSYEIISFKCDSAFEQSIYHLEDQYTLHKSDSNILLFAKKQQILQKVIKFFTDLLQLDRTVNKTSLVSEIVQLQIQQDRAKQVEDVLKHINMFIANADQVSIKVKFMEKKCMVFIAGQQQNVETCKEYITQSISKQDLDTSIKKFRLTQQQYKFVQRQKLLESYKQTLGIKFDVKQIHISRTVNLHNTSCTILLVSNPSLLCLPKTAVIILPQSEMQQIKQLQQTMHALKDYIFYSPEGKDVQVEKNFAGKLGKVVERIQGKVQDAVDEFVKFFIQTQGQIAVVLPKEKKQEFIQKIVNILMATNKKIKLYLLERNHEKKAIQALNNCLNSTKKWYVTIKGKKYYYSDQLSYKIQMSINSGMHVLQVTHDDLLIKKATHTYNEDQGQIVCLSSGARHFVQDHGSNLIVFVQNQTFMIQKPQNHGKQLIFGLYQIDIVNKMEKNLLSRDQKHICFEKVKGQTQHVIQDEKVETQISLKYPDEVTLSQIQKQIQVFIFKHKTTQKFDIQGISPQKIKQILNWCKLNKMVAIVDESNFKLVVSSFNQIAINSLEKLIEIHKKKLLAGALQYPTYWVEDQKQQLKLHEVDPKSKQFQSVETKFKIAKIKKLQRVQNKILFQKYNSQKNFLSQQNESPVRQVMMYHGTRANDPEMIYGDREQSFNINYANMGSYGKGIYFAKNSEYSNNYCYTVKGTGNKQMFYCLVLAGHSQIYTGKQTLNTNYRVPQKKIRYQSVVSSKNQQIMVVFKNRRAYPLYLITY